MTSKAIDILQGLPNELVLLTFRYGILNDCNTTTNFFDFLIKGFAGIELSSYLTNPFHDLCKFLINTLEMDITYSSIFIKFKRDKIRFKSIDTRFAFLNTIFINFVKLLIRFNLKFSNIRAIHAPESQYFCHLFESCSERLELISEDYNNFPKYTKSLKDLYISLEDGFGNLEWLPQLTSIESLSIEISEMYDEDKLRSYFHYLEKWVDNDFGKKKKINTWIRANSHLPLNVLVKLLELLANNHQVELSINFSSIILSELKAFSSLQKHIHVLNIKYFQNDNFFKLINSLDFLTTLKISKMGTIAGMFNLISIDNKRIDILTIEGEKVFGEVLSINNAEHLKTLSFTSASSDFSILNNLKYLSVELVHFLNNGKITLPTKLHSLSISSKIGPNNGLFIINNDSKLKYLKRVVIKLSANNMEVVPTASQLQNLVNSLPRSVEKLKIRSILSNAVATKKFNFHHLVNLSKLGLILNGSKLNQTVDSLNVMLDELPISIHDLRLITSVSDYTCNFPSCLRSLCIGLEGVTSINKFLKLKLEQLTLLSVLELHIGLVNDINLNLLPKSVNSFSLAIIEYTVTPVSLSSIQESADVLTEEHETTPITTIHLPFQSHNFITDIHITYSIKHKVVLLGDLAKEDKAKLNVSPGANLVWKTNIIDE